MTKKPLLVLVDGAALFHRGYHAIPHLTNKEGEPTNAIYGFTTILLKVLSELKPQYAVITWDKSSKTFRNRLYSEYKATRVKQPDDLYAQMPWVSQVSEALGLPFVELDDYEADDIIGTLAAQAKSVETVIVTGDMDELQLISDKVRVYTMRRGFTDTTIYDEAAVAERYGVTPAQFIDVKALKGDASDNIPGVPGIGEKTATDLIATYGSLESVYEHLDELKPAVRAKLKEHKELAYLSRELSTIVCDAPVKLELDKSRVGHYDRQAIHELFRKLDFRSLLAKLPPDARPDGQAPSLFDEPAVPKDRPHINAAYYHAVTTKDELQALMAELSKQPVIAIDTETDGLDVSAGHVNLVGLSLSWKDGEAYYVPVGHTNGTQLDCQYVMDELKPLLEDPKIGKVGHNIKFDYQVMHRYGVKLGPIVFDTMIAAFLINPLGRTQSLADLAYGELGIEMIPITDLIGTGKLQKSFDQALIEEATTYAAEDADISWRLYGRLKQQLEQRSAKAAEVTFRGQTWTLERLLGEIETPIISILAEMEIAGIEVDKAFLAKYGRELGKQLERLREEIWKAAGEEFNIGSPAQLSSILFDKLGLAKAGIKKGKMGFSTAAGELEKLQEAHPIVGMLLQYRELDKLKNTYIDALPDLVKEDDRIHTSFNQTIAQTGRLSSTNPNLQNIPVRTEVGREIRRAFVAPRGRVLVSADYSQIELRVAAALSGDETMIETFRQGIDLHQQTAAELFDVPLESVTKDQRSASKTINFGVLYGMSAHGLGAATGMTREQAAGFIKRYFEVRPQLAAYIEETKKFARTNEYTQTLFGRRRPCPEINSNNFQVASAAERMAVNVPIQGTAADIYKLAMIVLAGKLDAESKLLLQIHDELIVETPTAQADTVAELMREVMENTYDLGVPLAVETASGRNWGEL